MGEFKGLVIGLPNVGKSTLINRLLNVMGHRRNAAKVGKLPGITKKKQKFCLEKNDKIYVHDTPGLLMPTSETVEEVLKLSLVDVYPNRYVDHELLAQYLLYVLNKGNHLDYVKLFDLKSQTEDIIAVLKAIALKLGKVMKGQKLDLNQAASYFISLYKDGKLGKVILDDIPGTEVIVE